MRRSARRSRPASASASTATTTWTASARRRSRCSSCAGSAPTRSGTCRAVSTRATGSRATTLDRLAEEGCGLVITVDCGITAVEEVARAKELGLEVVVTDHHRPGRDAARLPGRRDATVRISVPGALRDRRRLQARGGHSARRISTIISTSSGSRRSPTSSRSSTRTARSRSRGCARSRARRRSACARSCRSRASIRRRWTKASVGFRLAPRINAAGRLGHPRAALELLLTDDQEEAKRLAYALEDVNRERQAVEERILRAAVAQIESWPENRSAGAATSSRAQDWHEGRDRDRRVASRRALPASGRSHRRHRGPLEGLGTFGARVRPARRRCRPARIT